jgi:LysM repeat protein
VFGRKKAVAPPESKPDPPKKEEVRWFAWIVIGAIALSIASAGCKDRRLLDEKSAATSVKKVVKETTAPPAVAAKETVPLTTTTVAPTTTVMPTVDYLVVAGDSLFAIGKKFGVSIQSILSANNMSKTAPLQAGQKIRIPTVAPTTTTPVAGSAAPGSPRTSIVTITVVVTIP